MQEFLKGMAVPQGVAVGAQNGALAGYPNGLRESAQASISGAPSQQLRHSAAGVREMNGQYAHIGSLGGSAGLGRLAGNFALAEKQAGHLEDLHNRLSETLKLLHDTLARSRELANRLLGTQPEAVGKDACQAVPQAPSSLSRLEDTSGYLLATAHELQAQLARLERL